VANFAILGVAGYIAPRHLEAIRAVGGQLVAAVDPCDSVGLLDRYGLDVRYSRDIEILSDIPLDWLIVCTPNRLHLEHCWRGLELGANVICEKPLALSPNDLKTLRNFEKDISERVYTVLQLRLHPEIIDLKDSLDPDHRYSVEVIYHTPRGPWYWQSWKGDKGQSGGLFFNIGIHLFDLLLWLFGPVGDYAIAEKSRSTAWGTLRLQRADVKWSLSVDPLLGRERNLLVDGLPIDLTNGFDDLHTEVYRQTLAGNGFGTLDARSSIELCHEMSIP
jgi:UDP-N-acetyl-2-amino-2-deoxyglucuronate dehydrogenase